MCIIQLWLTGWQNHPVCHHRWHILIPVIEDMYVTATSVHHLPALPTEGKPTVKAAMPKLHGL